MEGQLKVAEWALTAWCMSFGDSAWVAKTYVCNTVKLKQYQSEKKQRNYFHLTTIAMVNLSFKLFVVSVIVLLKPTNQNPKNIHK